MTSHYLPPSLSDHSPILFECCAGTSGGGRPFRFLNVLAGHAQFHESVTAAWDASVSGLPMQRLWSKLKKVKVNLKQLHVQHFVDTTAQVDQATKDLERIQGLLAQDITNVELQQQEAQAIQLLNYWLSAQESVYKQKSRVDWLQLGGILTPISFLLL